MLFAVLTGCKVSAKDKSSHDTTTSGAPAPAPTPAPPPTTSPTPSPSLLGEAAIAQDMSQELLKEGVYIKGLWYPVVPKGEARLRAQISASHTRKDLDRALEAFNKVGQKLGVI